MQKQIFEKVAINFHFTRVCNFECKFCFHTKKNSDQLSLDKQLQILKILREAGAEKINFAGGEPFLFPETLGTLVKESKQMGYESVSIISNGSRIKKNWILQFGDYLDILGISCDSLDPLVNFIHGRKYSGSVIPRDETQNIRNCSDWAREKGILFKINTVVTSQNYQENMSSFINEINPIRWKVFQVLDVEGENYSKSECGPQSRKNINQFLITKDQFQLYLDLNGNGLINKEILIPESNELMRSSYLLVDESGRFLDCSTGSKIPTDSILEVGLQNAYYQLISSPGKGFHHDTFIERGGYYPEKWSKH